METFKDKGKEFWEKFGVSFELPPRVYFDLVSDKQYTSLLKKYRLKGKTVIEVGAGFPVTSSVREFAPLASQLQEIIEARKAEIIPIDIAISTLEQHKILGRQPILASAFNLPFQNESIDGGAIILNLFNASFIGTGGREIFITLAECEEILREIYRALQNGTFVIISNYGYVNVYLGPLKILGPNNDEIISSEMIADLAEKISFRKVENIPLDETRHKTAIQIIYESYPLPPQVKRDLKVELLNPYALFLEK